MSVIMAPAYKRPDPSPISSHLLVTSHEVRQLKNINVPKSFLLFYPPGTYNNEGHMINYFSGQLA
jgi:hypothetical protein